MKIFYLKDSNHLIVFVIFFSILYNISSLKIYTPGMHVLISPASIMLSGQTQVYLGGCLPT